MLNTDKKNAHESNTHNHESTAENIKFNMVRSPNVTCIHTSNH